ncbi:excalibur calcium-binding domain-containing protein [Pseudomonas sp. EL_65y_Pfl2_R95]|uniref:excalibur calcium-binding domain-containing protein n=1 Tax=Pseudomonas sp. EL_65y_Pfl2_R95 TaxID=3088698 RepID=UPI0030D918D2
MRKLFVVLILGFAFWHFYIKTPESPVITNIGEDGSVLTNPVIQQPAPSFSLDRFIPAFSGADTQPKSKAASRYSCDGRKYCSQMTSCEEAMYFLNNCPGVKMDGGGDGVPCERQWCR